MSCCILGCPNYGQNARKDTTYHLFPHPLKDKSRCRQWIEACNNPKVRNRDMMSVHKQYRICRRHFDSNCMNGACRRLLNTAVPTLHLNLKRKALRSPDKIQNKIDAIDIVLKDDPSEYNFDSSAINLTDGQMGMLEEEEVANLNEEDVYEMDTTEKEAIDYVTELEAKNELDDSKPKLPQKYLYLHKINMEKKNTVAVNSSTNPVDGTTVKKVTPNAVTLDTEPDVEYELFDVEDEKYYRVPLSIDTLKKWHDAFYKCEKNVLAQNVCSRNDPFEVCLSRKTLENTQHVFTYKVESEGKPLTNQKNSGRCWIFACLNAIRIPFMKQYNLDEFEFSQAYLFFWDKVERCHYFLNNIIETALRGEEVTGRLVSFLLNDPTCDGGQWDMLVNLINKHGLMPKKCFPESYSCEQSVRLNAVLKSKLREYTKVLRDLIENSATDEEVKAKLNEQMGEIYKIIAICLGIPDEKFKWEYYDKNKAYQCVGPIKPLDFYEKYVKPVFNVDDKICIVTDPRPSNSYGQAYTVECLGNVVGGRPVLYNNQPVELLMDLVTTSLKNSESVWFGCEVSKRFAGKQGIEDLNIHDFKLVFGVDIQITLSKADRLLYGESAMTHAMVFTAVSCDDNGAATKFRVENSWGEDRGEKGYLIMSADWFKEFVFEVVVDKSIVPKEVLEVFNQTPIVLPAWDPMGTLANGDDSTEIPTSLIVEEAINEDNSVVWLSKTSMEKLNLSRGNTVLLKGKQQKETVCCVESDDSGTDESIRMNRVVRNNLRVLLKDMVSIEKCEIQDGKHIHFSPFDDTVKGFTGNLINEYLEPYFEGKNKPIHKDDTFLVFGETRAVEFKVVNIDPAPYCIKASNTVLHCTTDQINRVKEQLNGISYNAIGGYTEQLNNIKSLVEMRLSGLSQPNISGLRTIRGILLHGPIGTGKKLIARAVANEIGAFFIRIDGFNIMSEPANLMRILCNTFEEAKHNAPAIIYIDNLDVIAPVYEQIHDYIQIRAVSQLVTWLNEIDMSAQVIILAATSRLSFVNPNCGELFDYKIEFCYPRQSTRHKILRIHTKRMRLGEDVDLNTIATETRGYTGAKLVTLCSEAECQAIRRKTGSNILQNNQINTGMCYLLAVTMADFRSAEKILLTPPLSETVIDVNADGETKKRVKNIVFALGASLIVIGSLYLGANQIANLIKKAY